MNPAASAVLAAATLFVGMLVFVRLGKAIGRRNRTTADNESRAGVGVIEGAVFALMGLLIAFSFSSAAARFENRRALIVRDANAIGAAYLRLDLLPDDHRIPLQGLFRELVDSRIRMAAVMAKEDLLARELETAHDLERRIWRGAVASCATPEGLAARSLVLPAINDIIAVANERHAGSRAHLPTVILALLIGLLMSGSFLAGYGLAASPGKHRVHSLAFAGILAASVYVIIDLEHPRIGLITLKEYDQATIDLRRSME